MAACMSRDPGPRPPRVGCALGCGLRLPPRPSSPCSGGDEGAQDRRVGSRDFTAPARVCHVTV
eukprot:scaffold7177_cov114-Isochrysis_galbana.AAC.2